VIANSPIRRNLLGLDDEPEICQLVETVASDLGFDTASAVDPALVSAGQIADANLLVLDLMMPGTDGIEILRDLNEASHRPDIVLISGLDQRVLDSASNMAKVHGLRVVGVLRKPFRTADLRVLLETYLKGSANPVAPAARGVGPQFSLNDVEQALARDEFVVHFQPQVSLADDSWVGVEALARWQHPVYGLLYPSAFISIAESEPLALSFTEHVIRIALRQYNRLALAVGFQGTLSVNMPPTALTDVHFPERLLPLLREQQVPPAAFILEITENSLPESDKVVLDITTRLSMRGVRVSIDDFGTGTSGLERLQDTPFDELKIDMVFVRNAQTGSAPAATAIVESAAALGHRLKMNVVAEGVETRSTIDWLRSVGCDVAQGFEVGRPMAVDDLISWATARQGFSGIGAGASPVS
jgi:EAL domain-containing protein (putative c-di-GMP-specific phosphodiesterase class I)